MLERHARNASTVLLLVLGMAAGCGRGEERAGEAEARDTQGDGTALARRFVMYEDSARMLMLLDARTGRTWHRPPGARDAWRPFRITRGDTARNYTPLRGLARADTARREREGGAVLLRFEIHGPREPVPLLLDRRTGRTWFREARSDGTFWWTPIEVVPTDTTGTFAPLRAAEDT